MRYRISVSFTEQNACVSISGEHHDGAKPVYAGAAHPYTHPQADVVREFLATCDLATVQPIDIQKGLVGTVAAGMAGDTIANLLKRARKKAQGARATRPQMMVAPPWKASASTVRSCFAETLRCRGTSQR